MVMDTNTVLHSLQSYKESVIKKAEQLIVEGFSDTIIKLNEILDTYQIYNRRVIDIHQDLTSLYPTIVQLDSEAGLPVAEKTKFEDRISQEGTKVIFVPPTRTVPTNTYLTELIGIVKPYVRKLVEDSSLLKMWIILMIPKIEDGNNFGVSVQEATLVQIKVVKSGALEFLDYISRSSISRANLISKVVKYPQIDDYRRAVQETDEREYASLWLMITEIRNSYCVLHDFIIKNLDKIKEPRATNVTESMY